MIYSNSRELRRADMDEVQRWILSLLKPEEQPTIRALKNEFILEELLIRYCKLSRHKYPDHRCSKCNGEDNIIPDVDLDKDKEIKMQDKIRTKKRKRIIADKKIEIFEKL